MHISAILMHFMYYSCENIDSYKYVLREQIAELNASPEPLIHNNSRMQIPALCYHQIRKKLENGSPEYTISVHQFTA